MVRACFFSLGFFVTLWGVGFLFVDRVVLNLKDESTPAQKQDFRGMFTSVGPEKKLVFDPPDWAAFSLLSIGSVTMLYAAALPRHHDH